jgi:hypothetical protein
MQLGCNAGNVRLPSLVIRVMTLVDCVFHRLYRHRVQRSHRHRSMATLVAPPPQLTFGRELDARCLAKLKHAGATIIHSWSFNPVTAVGFLLEVLGFLTTNPKLMKS